VPIGGDLIKSLPGGDKLSNMVPDGPSDMMKSLPGGDKLSKIVPDEPTDLIPDVDKIADVVSYIFLTRMVYYTMAHMHPKRKHCAKLLILASLGIGISKYNDKVSAWLDCLCWLLAGLECHWGSTLKKGVVRTASRM